MSLPMHSPPHPPKKPKPIPKTHPMANTSAILLALMVVATALMAVPTASLTVNGIIAANLNITGNVNSLVTVNPVPVGLNGANVSVTCNNTTLAQVTAGSGGGIAVIVNLPASTVINIQQCIVKVVIPTSAVTLPTVPILGNLTVISAVTIPGVGLSLNALISASA